MVSTRHLSTSGAMRWLVLRVMVMDVFDFAFCKNVEVVNKGNDSWLRINIRNMRGSIYVCVGATSKSD